PERSGYCLLHSGAWDRAIRELEEAIRLWRRMTENKQAKIIGGLNLATAYRYQGRLDQARAVALEALGYAEEEHAVEWRGTPPCGSGRPRAAGGSRPPPATSRPRPRCRSGPGSGARSASPITPSPGSRGSVGPPPSPPPSFGRRSTRGGGTP